MSTLSFGLKLVDSNSSIANAMMRALLPELNEYFNKLYAKLQNNIPPIIINHIKNQPEYSSLMSGSLKAEFGIPEPETRLNSILSAISNGSIIQKKPLSVTNGKIRGSIKLQMIQKDFADLISLGESSLTTEKGTQLNWLRWLLIEGDSVIISEHYFIAGPYSTSRTGMGIMHKFEGTSWRVPPEFAGNINNNWITRAIDAASSDIQKELENIARL